MYKNLLNLLRIFDETDINKKFLYLNENTEFIFGNLGQEKIIGINDLLKNTVITVLDEELKNDKQYIRTNMDLETTGWIKKEGLLRVYRLSKINGKVNENLDKSIQIYRNKKNLEKIINKVVKAYYYFNYLGEDFLLVEKIGSKNYIPVKISEFSRLIQVTDNLEVSLEKGKDLYLTSNFDNVEFKLETDGFYKVHSYFKGLSCMRIHIGNKKYWIKNDTTHIDTGKLNFDKNQLEIMDYINYLTENNHKLLNEHKNNKHIIKQIRKSIVIDIESQELYINKYMGDKNATK